EARGDLEEALRIRREEELPVYERLGDVRERAITMGQIADILGARGDLEEALRIRREEELPVYERLGDVRERAITMAKMGLLLHEVGDSVEALDLMRRGLQDAEKLGIPEAELIRRDLERIQADS
ncbi:MAG: tetratricopeptide repeat protein, partial [Acidobacteriota bacterium]|nr:tetratricopeptide repeat protein [Acidobacteriota bacterium]